MKVSEQPPPHPALDAKAPTPPPAHLRLRDLPPHERPQERLERHGAHALTDREILALLIRSGTTKMDVLAIADALLSRAGSLTGILRWNCEDFRQVPGLGRVKALQLTLYVEIVKRLARAEAAQDPTFDDAEIVFQHLYPETRSDDVEKVRVLCLNSRNKLIRMETVTSGTANASLIHPREVFRPAVRHGATAVILVHNHPGGDPAPSKNDLQATKNLREAAKHLGVLFHDHVVIGDPARDPRALGYYSFRDSGLL